MSLPIRLLLPALLAALLPASASTAGFVDRVLGRQMERLKSFLDTGKPESPEGSGK